MPTVLSRRSDQPLSSEAETGVLRDDQMIDQVNSDHRTKPRELVGHGNVYGRRTSVTGGMIVCDDHGCGIDAQGKSDEFSQIKRDFGVRASIKRFIPAQPHFIVEKEGMNKLPMLAHAQSQEKSREIVRAADLLP